VTNPESLRSSVADDVLERLRTHPSDTRLSAREKELPMTALFKLSRGSLDELEEELVAHAQRINAAEYAFLELVR